MKRDDDEKHGYRRLRKNRIQNESACEHGLADLGKSQHFAFVYVVSKRTADKRKANHGHKLGESNVTYHRVRPRQLIHLPRDYHKSNHASEKRNKLAEEKQPIIAGNS